MIEMLPALKVHYDLLSRWRGAMDLVGPGPLEPHFEDAEAAVRMLPRAFGPKRGAEGGAAGPAVATVSGEWVDLGSGAGFPGVALAAIHPEARVLLLERRQKRATFLEEVVAGAKLGNARVVCGDSRDLPDGSFDGVISRAYKPPPEVLVDARRLLKPGGVLVLMLATEGPPAHPGFEIVLDATYHVIDRSRRVVGMRLSG